MSDQTAIKGPAAPGLTKTTSHDGGMIKKRPFGKLTGGQEKEGAERGKSTQADGDKTQATGLKRLGQSKSQLSQNV